MAYCVNRFSSSVDVNGTGVGVGEGVGVGVGIGVGVGVGVDVGVRVGKATPVKGIGEVIGLGFWVFKNRKLIKEQKIISATIKATQIFMQISYHNLSLV